MPEKKQTEGRGAYEWVQALVCSVLTVVLIFTFAVRIVRVSGESMRGDPAGPRHAGGAEQLAVRRL